MINFNVMYYIFFETGNERFFRSITMRFVSKIVQYIYDAYESVKQAGSDALNRQSAEIFFHKNGRNLSFFNCALFPDLHCNNQDCMAAHTAVLTSSQWEIFNTSMIETKNHYLRDPNCSILKRAGLQTMFQYYEASNNQQCKIIDPPRADSRLYIKHVKKLAKNGGDFVYIRDETQSDFDYFRNNARLPNVTACGHFKV